MKNHKKLDNPYELKMDRGRYAYPCDIGACADMKPGPTTKELLIELEKTRSRAAGNADELGILETIYEGAELQSLRCACLYHDRDLQRD